MTSSGYLSLLSSIRKKPLEHWSKRQSQSGRVWKTSDSDLLENVVELQDLQKSNNSNTFITCPALPQQTLDVTLPILVIVVKNMSVECRFRIQIVDEDQNRCHFHFSNESTDCEAAVRTPVISRVHFKLEPGWNRLEINLNDLTQRAFNSRYKATQRLAISANCRLRRVYFVDRHYDDSEMSVELCRTFFEHYLLERGFPLDQKTGNHSRFLTDVRSKSAALMNEFLTKSKTRLENGFDFRSKMRLIFLAIPRIGEQLTPQGVCSQKSNCGSTRCMTPTRNKTPSKSVARYEQGKTERGDSSEAEPVEFVKQIDVRSNSVKNKRRQDKPRLKNCKESLSGISNIPKVVSGDTAGESTENRRAKNGANNLERLVNKFQGIADAPKSEGKRERKRGRFST